MTFLHIATGVIFVLLGMRHLRKGLDRLFGNRLIDWLQKMTSSRFQGFLAGIVAGCVAPSSTAVAMLSIQMLNRTGLTAGPMLAVLLGANVGITIAVQLLAFRLQDYAGAFLVVGGVFHLFLKRPIFRGAGQILIALGFIFLAMQMISGSAGAAAANPDLKSLFHIVEKYPWVIFIATAILTVAVQSSTASIGLGIGLAQGGLLSQAAMLPWVLGSTLGIALTGMIAGWASIEGRRLAVGNLLVKTAGVLPLLLAGNAVSTRIFHLLPGAIDQQIANLNTLFNVLVGLLALPLLGPLSRLLNFLIESPDKDTLSELQSYLDPVLLQAPSLALNQATREQLRIIDELKHMLHTVWVMLWGKNIRLLTRVEEFQRRIEELQQTLQAYLGEISDENLSADDIHWKFALLDYSQELDTIARLVRRDLADAFVRQIKSGQELSAGDRPELETLYTRTLERIEKATVLLMGRDLAQAERFIHEKEEMNQQFRAGRRARLDHLPSAQAASPALADMLTCLRRINSHLTAIAYSIARGDATTTRSLTLADDLDTEDGRQNNSTTTTDSASPKETIGPG